MCALTAGNEEPWVLRCMHEAIALAAAIEPGYPAAHSRRETVAEYGTLEAVQ